MNNKNSFLLIVHFEKGMWVAHLKRTSKEGISIAKHIFGNEPSNGELYDFVLHEIHKLPFTSPKELTETIVQQYRKNYKRTQRDVRKELRKTKLKKETLAQESQRISLEKEAKEKQKKLTREEKKSEKQNRFQQKQQKKKNKLKGH